MAAMASFTAGLLLACFDRLPELLTGGDVLCAEARPQMPGHIVDCSCSPVPKLGLGRNARGEPIDEIPEGQSTLARKCREPVPNRAVHFDRRVHSQSIPLEYRLLRAGSMAD